MGFLVSVDSGSRDRAAAKHFHLRLLPVRPACVKHFRVQSLGFGSHLSLGHVFAEPYDPRPLMPTSDPFLSLVPGAHSLQSGHPCSMPEAQYERAEE